MPSETKKWPSVLMLMLSALGLLFSVFVAAGSFMAGTVAEVSLPERPMLTSIAMLSLFLGLLITPSLILSIRKLAGREAAPKYVSLFKHASLALIAFFLLLLAGYLLSRQTSHAALMSLITTLCVLIPVWWLVEFSRRGLARPAPLKEWGTLTVGLTAAPLVILLVEIMLLVLAALAVFILIGMQPGALTELMDLTAQLQPDLESLEALEQLLSVLMQNPVLGTAIFLVIGVLAPFAEESFKPLAVWLVRRKTLRLREGFELGLVSGGAFALLESASLVSQITTESWLSAVLLRALAGMLHVGLSGLVGYGIAKARCERQWGTALLCLLGGTALHGLWNSMALVNGFSGTPLAAPETASVTAGSVLSLICMAAVFAAIVFITLRLRARFRQEQINEDASSVEEIHSNGGQTLL